MSSFIHEHGMPTREDFIKSQGLPNINYFTFDQQQNFIHNLPLVKGATLNTLQQIEQSLTFSNIPLIIPYTSSYNKKWSYEQLEAFAMQGIEVYQNKENGIPQFPYIYNLVGSGKAPGYNTYYERFLTTQQPDPRIYSGRAIGTGFKRGQAYQAPITEPAVVTITEPLLPEVSILPAAHAEPETVVDVWATLSQETKTIINNFPSNLKAPNWALTYISNNINWLLEGKITEKVFLLGYNDYIKKGTIILIDKPEEVIDQTSTNMIRQELISFTIINNRIQGSIKFTATDAFNPYFYNKPITNYLQLKSEGFPIKSPTNPKSNRLTFTETERDEIITFDEDAQNFTFVSAESFIEPSMSEVLTFTIEAGKEATTTKTGLMGAGVLGIIGILMLGGFIADHVRKRK